MASLPKPNDWQEAREGLPPVHESGWGRRSIAVAAIFLFPTGERKRKRRGGDAFVFATGVRGEKDAAEAPVVYPESDDGPCLFAAGGRGEDGSNIITCIVASLVGERRERFLSPPCYYHHPLMNSSEDH